MMKSLLLGVVGAALSIFGPSEAAFGQGNPQSQVLGGRSALMGGTGVALGADSAAPFLNPAVIANIQRTSLALSSQLVEFRFRTLSGFRQPNSGESSVAESIELEDANVNQVEVRFVPAAVCYFQRIGDREGPPTSSHTLSLCFGTTELLEVSALGDSEDGSSVEERVDLVSSVESSWKRQEFGLSWGHDFVDWFSAGASVLVGLATQRVLFGSGILLTDLEAGTGQTNGYSLSLSADSVGLRGEFGVLFRLSDRIRLGASARTPSWFVLSNYDSATVVNALDGSSRREVISAAFDAPAPIRFATGLGYEGKRLTLELDLFFFPSQGSFLEVDGERELVTVDSAGNVTRESASFLIRESSKFTANVNFGVEYDLARRWSLLSGFQTDFSLLDSRSEIDPDRRIAVTSRDFFHASLGTGYRGRFGNIVSGVRFSYSDGETLAVNNFTNEPEVGVASDELISVLLILYGSIDFTAIASVITPD
ncbi:MAG: hypothetical protein ACFB9M_12825 [Myxococcota bacterium]